MGRLVGGLALALLALAFSGGAAAAPPPPATVSHVTMFSDPGDYIGGGVPRFFVSGADSISVSGNASSVAVAVSGGPYGDSFTLTFAAPPGQTLHPGLYTGAQRTSFRQAGHPGIDISGSGRGCNEDGGRFDVKDLATDRRGNVTRLWLTYEQHCENGQPSLFGEVQLAAPAGSLLAVPDQVWWPDTFLGGVGTAVPVVFLNKGTSTVTVSSTTLAGVGSDSFALSSNACTGATLPPGAGCRLYVRFVPGVAGPRVAALTLTTTSGVATNVQLDGAGTGGRTALTMTSDAGDYIGAGLSYSYTPTSANLSASGGTEGVHGSVDAADGSWWYLDFVPAAGDVLTAGSTYTATRYPFNGSGPGMAVSGNGRGCNTLTGSFTVNSISTALDGSLLSASIGFEQHCEGATPALHGTFEYRAPTGDVTPPAPVTALTAKRSSDRQHVDVGWTKPGDPDLAFVVVRYLPTGDTPGSPDGSLLGYAGSASSTSLPIGSKTPVTVAVWAVDTSGNVSPPAVVSLR